MNCNNCGNQVTGSPSVCPNCGHSLPQGQYSPPDGYLLDAASGLYYSEKISEDDSSGQPIRIITWFDSATGLSQQVSYPVIVAEQTHPSETEQVSAQNKTNTNIPDGFSPYTGTDYYYSSKPGLDPKTGAPCDLVTFFDPKTGEYHEVSYPRDNNDNKVTEKSEPTETVSAPVIKAEVKKKTAPPPPVSTLSSSPLISSAPSPAVDIPPTPTPIVDIPPTPTPVVDIPPTPTPAVDILPTPTPVVDIPPTPTPAVDILPTPTPTVDIPPTPTPAVDIPPTPTPAVDIASVQSEAPEGFVYDAVTGCFYRIVVVENTWWITWYNPQTRQYTQDDYNAVQPTPSVNPVSGQTKGKRGGNVLPIFCISISAIALAVVGAWAFDLFPFQKTAIPSSVSSEPSISSEPAVSSDSDKDISSIVSSEPPQESSDISSEESSPTYTSGGVLEYGTPMNAIFPENWQEMSFEELQNIIQNEVDNGNFNAMDMDSLPGFFLPSDASTEDLTEEELEEFYSLFSAEADINGNEYQPEKRPTLAIYSNGIFIMLASKNGKMTVLVGDYYASGLYDDGDLEVALTPIDDSLEKFTGHVGYEIFLSAIDYNFVLSAPALGDSLIGETFVMQ